MELRCPNDLRVLAVLNNEGDFEVRCKSRYCGAQTGYVVIHVYNRVSGELVETKLFKDPYRRIT